MLQPTHDQPIMTFPDHLRREGLGFLAYRKPGFGLILLREVVLGEERFDAAFKEYIRRWANKHPQPADFFRTMEDVSGRDLAWFWRGFFYTTAALDQSVESVTRQLDGAGKTSMLKVIAGESPPHSGTVLRQGAFGYLLQEARPRGSGVDATALSHILSGRGLDEQA